MAATAVAGTSHAGPLDGHWKLQGNPYRSHIELHIVGDGVGALIGCEDVGYQLTVEGSQVRFEGTLVREAPCVRSDRRKPRAWAYWHRIGKRLGETRSAEVDGQRLLLRQADGRKLTFVRMQNQRP